MKIPEFNTKELKVVSEIPESPFCPAIKVFDYPVAPKQAHKSFLEKNAYWQITNVDSTLFTPMIFADNIARGQVFESYAFDPTKEGGGKDIFGIEWEYDAHAGGSMVRPGKPLMEDANEWKEKIIWPDIDLWDWEGTAKANNTTYLETDRYINAWFVTGWFERLITFMDFEGAIMAMYDDDQKDAVKEFFAKLSDLYVRILDKFLSYFPNIDGVCFHDDWGSQKETFFSPELAAEMIVPYMKKVTDFIHSTGRRCELHSCGQIIKQVPNMIAAGWDYWNPQLMNDTHKIYELYGDKIIIGTAPESFDPLTASEAEQRAIARGYADKFCNPDKPSFLNRYSSRLLTPAFREELYIRSREKYSG